MQSLKRALGFGFLAWAFPFAVAFLIFPIRVSNRPLFESIMPVTVTLLALVFSLAYFRHVKERFFREGILLGILWMTVSLALDLLMFLPPSPWQMPLLEYFSDIGLTYLILLFVCAGMGAGLQGKAFRQVSAVP